MSSISQEEISRQDRVLKMRIEMHSILRSRYKWRARAAEIVLLAGSVLFAVTTFGSDDFFTKLGITTVFGDTVLKLTAITVFLASLILLLLDWNGRAVRHDSAFRRLSHVLKIFREAKLEDKCWESSRLEELSEEYWRTSDDVEPIPPNKFNQLKSQYLIKKRISILKGRYPGCPRPVIWICLVGGDTWHGIRHSRRSDIGEEQ